MDHAGFMCRSQAGAKLSCQFDAFFVRQMADAPQQSRKIFAIDVLHRQEVHRTAVDERFSNVVYAADVGMGNATCRSYFVMKPGEHGAVTGKSRWEEFQRYKLMQRQILGLINLAHAAAAQKTDDPVSAR